MPHAKHQNSEPGFLAPVVGAASVPPTQVDVAYGGNYLYDQYQCNEAVSGVVAGQYISFTCNPTFEAMTDVGESYIYVQGYYQLDADVLAGNLSVTTPPFLSACLFNDFTLSINGTQIVASQGIAQPYAMVANIIKNQSSSDRANGQLTEGYLLDPYGGTQITAGVNASSDQRRVLYMEKAAANSAARPFGLVYRLADAGLRTKGGWLPPNVQLQIRARRTQPNFMRIGAPAEVTAANPVFVFTSATAMIARKILSTESRARIENIWNSQPLRLPFERIRTSVNWFQAGAQDINLSNQIAGPTPSAVMVFVIQDTAINQTSTGVDNPMALAPLGNTAWQNVSLSVGGARKYPVQPLSMLTNTSYDPNVAGNTLDLGVAYQLYRACANESPFLNDIDFTNILPL
jgi:hypothetical protein